MKWTALIAVRTLVAAIGAPLTDGADGTRSVALRGEVRDHNGVPIAAAVVELSPPLRTIVTDGQGEFRFDGLAPGSYALRVRHVGHVPYEDSVAISDADVLKRVALRPVHALDPVTVVADRKMIEFDDNRRLGLGKFVTRAQLESQEQRQLGDVLVDVGAQIKRLGPHSWLANSRGLGRTTCAYLEGREVKAKDLRSRANPGCGCFAQVYLDGIPLYNGEEGGLVPDLSMIAVSSLEAVEYYRGLSQIPMRYQRLNARCGVLVLHTRRTPGKTREP